MASESNNDLAQGDRAALVAEDNPAAPRRVLAWIYLGRIALAAALLARLPVEPIERTDGTAYLAALMGVAILFSALSFGYTHSLQRRPSQPFLYIQVIFDALLLTGVVYLTGGERSMFSPLYILVISAGALLLPMVGGILIGLFASILFFLAAVATPGSGATTIFIQAGLFAIVAIITGYLGDRLRQTGAALGEVQTELRLLRLDTDDILETVGTGILTVDGRGRLVYLNPAAAEILSLSPSRWLDREILAQLDSIAPGLGEVIDRTALARRPISRYETKPLEDDTFILGVSTTPLERDGQERPPVTAIFQDITEKKRVEGLRRRAERLEAVAELSASLAHEIKNPLASIRSAVEQIASGKVTEEDQRFLGSLVVRESDRLSRLLGDFIDFARVRVVSPTPVEFSAIVGAVVDVVRSHPDTTERRVSVTFNGPDGPVYILGEEDLLHRAVFNLALNAVQWAGLVSASRWFSGRWRLTAARSMSTTTRRSRPARSSACISRRCPRTVSSGLPTRRRMRR